MSRRHWPRYAPRSSGIFLAPGHPLEQQIREAAQIQNPEYADHERMVRASLRSRMAPKPARTLSTWSLIPGGHPWAGGTMLPRHWHPARPLLARQLQRLTIDHFATAPIGPLTLGDGFRLRDYQREAVDAIERAGDGVIVMPCGAGKTSTGVGVIQRLGQRTLILVHTRDLAEQWIERIQGCPGFPAQLPGVEVGRVFDGTDQGDRPIVVATIQTLARRPWPELYRWGQRFGLVILDEAHHAPAESFLGVLFGLPARYRLGLTATPDREDGLGDLLWSCFGGVVYEVERGELIRRGAIRPARLYPHKTGVTVATHDARNGPKEPWRPLEDGHELDQLRKLSKLSLWPKVRIRQWASQVRDLNESEARNRLIVDLARKKVDEGHTVLILSERVAHCRHLASELREAGVAAAALAGKQSAADVSRIKERVRAGELRAIVGTTKADEGLDLPALSCGILVSRSKNRGRLIQRIGRVERPVGPAPEWHDLIDDFPGAARAWRARRLTYRALQLPGAEVKRRRRSGRRRVGKPVGKRDAGQQLDLSRHRKGGVAVAPPDLLDPSAPNGTEIRADLAEPLGQGCPGDALSLPVGSESQRGGGQCVEVSSHAPSVHEIPSHAKSVDS